MKVELNLKELKGAMGKVQKLKQRTALPPEQDADDSRGDAEAQSMGDRLIAAERARQISGEGWTAQHDDRHVRGELLDGALSYIRAAINVGHPAMTAPPREWPWAPEWWKPTRDHTRNLVKAGALIAAEIDRLSRESKKANAEVSQP